MKLKSDLITKLAKLAVLCSLISSTSDSLAETRVIEAGHFTRKVKATVHIPEGAIRGALLFNPGAYLQPDDMIGLGEEAASRGIVTYIIDNALNLPIAPNNQKASLRLVNAIFDGSIRNLPESIVQAHHNGLRFLLAGHSMGGAVLNSFHDAPGIEYFSGIALVGVSKLVDLSNPFPIPTYLVYGSQDQVVDLDLLRSLANELGAEQITMDGLNHFCIVSSNAGSDRYRDRDGETSLSKPQCVSRLVDTLESILLRR